MTAIRNKTTGEWVHNGPREQTTVPQFLALETSLGPRYRGDYLIAVDRIQFISQCPDGYQMQIEGRDEPILIQTNEYDHLMDVLTSAGMVTFPAPDVEAL